LLRTLTHHWRVNTAVLLGAAVATAVLAGALLVGDSVRGSLRDLTLDRLGDVDWALASDSFFREDLAADLEARPGFAEAFRGAAPAILVRGSAGHGEDGTRASNVSILGIDERFSGVFGAAPPPDFARAPGQVFPSVVVNDALRRELGAEVGDPVLLAFGRWSEVPRETLMGEKDPAAVTGSLRLTLRAVLPDRGPGRFGLAASQQTPLNAFVDLQTLQRALDLRGRVNAIVVAGGATDAEGPERFLHEAIAIEDLGLAIERRRDHLAVESREFVLRPALDEAAGAALSELGLPFVRTQSYLANALRAGDRLLPYSLVAALDPDPRFDWSALLLTDGTPAPAPAADGILLNAWAAEDLGAARGDEVEMAYWVVGSGEDLTEKRAVFRVEGVVALRGLGADRELTPDYPGIQEADDISAWDPPIPVDLDLIRPKDETYWDDFGAAPKAFVSSETGRRLWSTRFGATTAVRFPALDGAGPEETARLAREALRRRLDPQAAGFRFRAVKREGLESAAGATDFAGLFASFSFFLIVSAALLVGLLFRLGVERRAGEIGLLLAVGYRVARVRRRLLGEGALLAATGGLLGLAAGVAYAGALMAALRTIWLPAVGSSELHLHVTASSLAIGWAGAVIVVLASVWVSVRRIVRVPPPRLLAGEHAPQATRGTGRLSAWLAYGALALAAALAGYALATQALQSPGLAFGTGSLLLVAGLAFFSRWCRGSRHRAVAGLAGMASRNSSWNPGRSALSVALVACASFMIVVVEVFRTDTTRDLAAKTSGSGGFALVAESEVPLHQDLERREDRFDLGFSGAESEKLDGVDIYAARVLPGDDASCLNLYRPGKPAVLGLPEDFVARGGFTFQQVLDPPPGAADPWTVLDRELDGGAIPAVADWSSATWILHKKLGEDIVLQDEAGRPLRLRLVGLLDASIFRSEVLISERDFVERFPSRTGDAYFLIDAPPDRAPEVSRLLEERLASHGLDVTTTQSKIADYEAVQNTYLSTFQVLGGLGLLLGTLGLGIVLVRNVIERRGELATLRAFGFRRSRLAFLVLAENAFLLAVGVTLGTVAAGAAVAPGLAARDLPWPSLAATLLLVLLAGLLSSVAGVLGTLRVPLLPALKAER
jgi:ABC-type lipoprotein release transport system permease subunit